MHKVTTLCDHLDVGTGGVSVDKNGDIYVADFGMLLSDKTTVDRKIYKVSTDGNAVVFAKGFKGASGNAFDSKGNLFQSNIRGHCIHKIAPDGSAVEFVTQGLTSPVGITIDEHDTLYVANCGDKYISKITSVGDLSRYAESELFECPNGITFDESGNLYVANFNNGDVVQVTPDGSVSRFATIPGNNNGHITYHDGALYVVARTAHQIYRVSMKGDVDLFAGSGDKGQVDGPALEALFCYPNDIEISADGRCFYVNEVSNAATDGSTIGPVSLRCIWLS